MKDLAQRRHQRSGRPAAVRSLLDANGVAQLKRGKWVVLSEMGIASSFAVEAREILSIVWF